MPQYSVRVSEELGERIEAYADEYDGSQSDALRDLLRRGTEYDSIRQERDRLRNAQTQLIEQREENQELVEYVQRERALQERREERARRREKRKQRRQAATILQRVWWAIAGDPYAQQGEA
jgi:chromosome segregation ATPase